MKFVPEDGTWIVADTAAGILQLKQSMSDEDYAASKRALQHFLCDYFSSGNCDSHGANISPIGATPKGGKRFKVRWGYPGRGKSGSLRLCIAVYCDERRVVIAQAFWRNENPQATDFEQATEDL